MVQKGRGYSFLLFQRLYSRTCTCYCRSSIWHNLLVYHHAWSITVRHLHSTPPNTSRRKSFQRCTRDVASALSIHARRCNNSVAENACGPTATTYADSPPAGQITAVCPPSGKKRCCPDLTGCGTPIQLTCPSVRTVGYFR